VRCASTTESPLTHASGSVGNESVIAVERVNTARGYRMVPFISGNAMRHRSVRDPGVRWLLSEYGLEGKLTLQQQNFLLHGGNLSESTARENTKLIAEMKEAWPLLRLLGGSISNQILAGSLDVWRPRLVCEENRPFLQGCPASRLLSSESFVGQWQYTRGDAAKEATATDEPKPSHKSNLMIFSGQCVIVGAVFEHGFVLKHVSAVELGALLWSLRLWQQQGGTIGGQAARGHGRLRTELLDMMAEEQEEHCGLYVDYARSVKDRAIAWLNEAFSE
jgi:hypothetical protein